MRQFRFKTITLVSATTLFLGCSSSVNPALRQPLSVTTAASEYAPGAVVPLTVTNIAATAVQFGLRDIILERREGVSWTPLPHDELPSLLILHDLAPGASAVVAEPVIPADAIPGTYRFQVLTSENSTGAGSFDQGERLSNQWRLVAPTT